MGVRFSFVEEEQQDPQCIPMSSAIYVLEDVSLPPDILIWDFLSSFRASSIFTWVSAEHPLPLRPSFVMLMSPVQ